MSSTTELVASQLREGLVLALPFGRTATLQTVDVGARSGRSRFVSFRSEHGSSRVLRDEPVLVQLASAPGHDLEVRWQPAFREYRPECSCAWVGSYWPEKVRAVLEAARHVADEAAS